MKLIKSGDAVGSHRLGAVVGSNAKSGLLTDVNKNTLILTSRSVTAKFLNSTFHIPPLTVRSPPNTADVTPKSCGCSPPPVVQTRLFQT